MTPLLLSSGWFSKRLWQRGFIVFLVVLVNSLFIPATFAAPNDLTLMLLNTSESDFWSANNVMIGEVITYRLVYEVPEGASANVVIAANLPAGLQYVLSSATSAYTNDNGWSAPMTVSGGALSGAAVSFNFGNLNNTDVDANAETITIEFKAIVNNVLTNQSGTTLSVNGQLRINSILTTTSGSVVVTIIEPNLSVASYTINNPVGLIASAYPSAGAGDTYNYRVTFTNSGNAPAYNIVLEIIFPLTYIYETNGTYSISGATTCGGVTLGASLNPVTVTIPCLNPGATLSVQVNMTVNNTVQPLDSWVSSASLINYTSLPDENGSNNDVPGAYGTATGARNGSNGTGGGLNNYATGSTNSPTLSVPQTIVAFDSASSSASESVGIGNVLRITTSNGSPTSAAATVNVGVTGGTATTADYTLGGIITIPAGTAHNSLISVGSGFSVNNDTVVENDETVVLTLSAPSAGLGIATQTHVHTIQNDDTTTLTLSDSSIIEGNTGTSTLNFTVTSSAAVQGGFTVAYNLTDGTATIANNDYTATGSSLTFTGTAGEIRTIPVTIHGDRNIEANETFIAAFGAISGTTLGQANFVRSDTGTGTIINDDVAGITVTPTTIAITESGTTATFSLASTTNTVATVDILVTTDGQCLLSSVANPLPSTTLTVTLPSGTSTAINITVEAVDDNIDEGVHSCAITTGDPLSADTNYNNLTAVNVADVTATVTDDDTASISLSSITVTEGQAGVSMDIVLTSQPTSDVTITLTPDAQCTLVPPTLTFTNANWNIVQSVTVIAVDDALSEGAHTCVITYSASSADTNYVLGSTAHNVDVVDDDTASISLSSITVTEGQAGVGMDVVLTSQPTSDVTITLTPDTQCTLVPPKLTFTNVKWNIVQSVTVTAVDDALSEGAHTCVITYSTSSADTNYVLGSTAHNVDVTDDDIVGITLSSITVTEGQAGVGMDVVLTSQPTSDVTINFTPDAQCTLTPAMLTFTNGNWNTVQSVTVMAVDDALSEGAHTCVITYSASSIDTNYVLASTAHNADVVDNDTAGILLTPITVTEGQPGLSMNVELFTEPTADVTINFTPDAQCTLAPATLTFTNGAGVSPWNIAQQTLVTAVNDTLIEGVHPCVVSVSVTSTDANYGGLSLTHNITVRDNDSAVVEPEIIIPAIPAEVFLCGNLREQTNGAMTGSGDIGNVELNGTYGNTYCTVITLRGEFLRSSAQIGNASILAQGVVHAVDVYGLLPSGNSVVPFLRPAQICFAGSGSIYFLSSVAGSPPPVQLPTQANSPSGYACVSVPNAGKVVLVSTASPLPPAPPALATSTILAQGACQVTTTFAVRLRTTPDTSSDANVITMLPFDLTLVATEYLSGWYRVIYLDGQGWVSENYLNTTGAC